MRKDILALLPLMREYMRMTSDLLEAFKKKIESSQSLSEKEKKILYARYLSERRHNSFAKLSKELGVSRQRVAQLERSALKQLDKEA